MFERRGAARGSRGRSGGRLRMIISNNSHRAHHITSPNHSLTSQSHSEAPRVHQASPRLTQAMHALRIPLCTPSVALVTAGRPGSVADWPGEAAVPLTTSESRFATLCDAHDLYYYLLSSANVPRATPCRPGAPKHRQGPYTTI